MSVPAEQMTTNDSGGEPTAPAKNWNDAEATRVSQSNPDRENFSDDMFSFLDSTDDGGDDLESPPPSDGGPGAAASQPEGTPAATPPQAQVAPAPQPAATETTPPTTAAAPATTSVDPPQQTADVAAPTDFQPPVAQVSPEDQAKAYEEWRTNYIGQLTQEYAFSKEETQELMINPENVLPGKLAQMQANIVSSVLQAVNQNFASMMQQQLSTQTAQVKAREAFFNAFPKLQPMAQTHGEVMVGVIKAAAAGAQPSTPPQEIINKAGKALMAMFGLQEGAAPPPAAQPTSDTPITPPGARSTQTQGARTQNAFTQLNDMWDDLDS